MDVAENFDAGVGLDGVIFLFCTVSIVPYHSLSDLTKHFVCVGKNTIKLCYGRLSLDRLG
jgi:hypothetical protein